MLENDDAENPIAKDVEDLLDGTINEKDTTAPIARKGHECEELSKSTYAPQSWVTSIVKSWLQPPRIRYDDPRVSQYVKIQTPA